MASPVVIEYVGLAPSALSTESREKLEAFVEAANRENKLLGVRVFPNFDAVGEDLPSGMMAIYSPDARVDATLLSDDLFQIMGVVKVPQNDDANMDQYFTSKLAAIQSAVDQNPTEPVKESIRKPVSNKETQPWAPQLGGRNAFAGVYSCVQDGDTRSKEYYLMARATISDYVHDLKRDISVKQPTYRDLLYGDQLHFAKNAARRNVHRILSNLGEACGLDIPRMDDLHAKLPTPDCAPCEMAVPDWEHMSHSIINMDYKGRPAVGVSYGVVPANECLADEHFFVVANPYDGISRFPISNHEDVKSAIGLPLDTGRKTAPSQLMGAQIPAERMKGVTWEGKTTTHYDLHQDAFRPLGKEFKFAMREMGWNPEHHIDRLIPIAIKIASPSLE